MFFFCKIDISMATIKKIAKLWNFFLYYQACVSKISFEPLFLVFEIFEKSLKVENLPKNCSGSDRMKNRYRNKENQQNFHGDERQVQ